MDRPDLERLIARFLDAWNAQDVERVTACYTEDVRYRDPNTRGHVEGREALRRYLRKLFATWQMSWASREVFELAVRQSLIITHSDPVRMLQHPVALALVACALVVAVTFSLAPRAERSSG